MISLNGKISELEKKTEEICMTKLKKYNKILFKSKLVEEVKIKNN